MDDQDQQTTTRRSQMTRLLGTVTAGWRTLAAALGRMTAPTPPYVGGAAASPPETSEGRSAAPEKGRLT